MLERFAFRGQAANGTGREVLERDGLVLWGWDLSGTKLVFRGAVFRRCSGNPFYRQHWTQREKHMPARLAPHRGKAQPAPYCGCNSGNFLRGDSLQLQVAANAASHVAKMPQRNRSRVEACFTSHAAPRNDTYSAKQIFRDGTPSGTPAGHSLTRWTAH
jgi:hypothetical protein